MRVERCCSNTKFLGRYGAPPPDFSITPTKSMSGGGGRGLFRFKMSFKKAGRQVARSTESRGRIALALTS